MKSGQRHWKKSIIGTATQGWPKKNKAFGIESIDISGILR
jgi:hypothetical protein